MAGAAPNNTAAKSATPMVNPKTYGSRLTLASHGSAGDCHSRMASMAKSADGQPPRSRQRTNHHAFGQKLPRQPQSRPAPNAPRTATSWRRAAARTSCRLAILAQAISSTKPTAASSTDQRFSRISREVALQGNDFQFPSFGHVRQRRRVQMKPGLLERLQLRPHARQGVSADAASQAHAKTLTALRC